jgi:hypothetical protein
LPGEIENMWDDVISGGLSYGELLGKYGLALKPFIKKAEEAGNIRNR